MRFSTVTFVSAAAGLVAAAPYNPFPLDDGFPNPSSSQLAAIGRAAGGNLPNGPLPTTLSDTATVTLQLIALNEIFEVAYFTDLLANVTNGVYDVGSQDKQYVIDTLKAVQKQEELHHLGANAILANAGKEKIKACKYQFPVSSFKSAITLANTFTDVVLGVLPQAQVTFASDNGYGYKQELSLVNLIGAIIAQEGEQNGYYRYVQGKTPSAAPFLTTEGPSFAFTFLQSVIVPGSCPNIENIKNNIPTLKPLTVVSGAKNYDSTVTYSVPDSVSSDEYSIVYLSGQTLPVTVPIKSVQSSSSGTTFQASLPFDSKGFANGLTIATLVKCTDKQFSSASEVATKAVYGPGIIEID